MRVVVDGELLGEQGFNKEEIGEVQALAGSRFSIPGFSGTGFCQIPGSRDFSGRDLPL